MNITKELLQDLGIVSMKIVNNNQDLPCYLVQIEKDMLHIKFSGNFVYSENATLSITTKESFSQNFVLSEAQILITEYGLDYFLCKIISSEDIIKGLLQRISFLEYQDEKYGRRKEPRVHIGKEKAQQFGLASIEQKLFSYQAKIIQPCAISDVSLHGICIITPFDDHQFKNIKNFNIQITFSEPNQTVNLEAHKVHIKLNHTFSPFF